MGEYLGVFVDGWGWGWEDEVLFVIFMFSENTLFLVVKIIWLIINFAKIIKEKYLISNISSLAIWRTFE